MEIKLALRFVVKALIVLITCMASLPMTLIALYFMVFGEPKPLFITHQGPMWYWPDHFTMILLVEIVFAWLFIPAVLVFLGLVTAISRKSLIELVFYFSLALFQFLWGIFNFFAFFYYGT